MKKCPFCAEDIQDAAIKCKHCGEFLNSPARPPALGNEGEWYFRTPFIIIAVLSLGPFALPLIWRHPNASRASKIALTTIILLLTIGILVVFCFLFRSILHSIEMLKPFMQHNGFHN